MAPKTKKTPPKKAIPHNTTLKKRKTRSADYWRFLLDDDEFDDDEDEDEASTMFLLCAAAAISKTCEKKERPSFYVCDRLEWDTHVAELLQEEFAFRRLYRMSSESFDTFAF